MVNTIYDKCPKCEVKWTLKPDPIYEHGIVIECFNYTCPRCGYKWSEEITESNSEENSKDLLDLSKVSRVEVIDNDNGRVYGNCNVLDVYYSLQDDNKTLKLFITNNGEI